MRLKVFYIISTIFIVFGCNNNVLKNWKTDIYERPDVSYVDADFKYDSDIIISNDKEITVSKNIPIPINVSASQADYSDRIVISWKPVSYRNYDAKYYVYRKSSENESFFLLNDEPITVSQYVQVSSTSDIDFGKTYKYAVRAFIAEKKLSSPLSNIVEGWTIGAPTYFSATLRDSKDVITLKWEPVSSVKYYVIQRAKIDVGGDVPKSKFLYSSIGNPISASKVGANGKFEYKDYSKDLGGDLISQNEYFYILISYKDSDTYSQPSKPARGGLFALGVPAQPEIKNVSKALFNGAIRVSWVGTVNKNKYIIYRITDEDIKSGNINGKQLSLQDDDIKKDDVNNYFYFYDKDSEIGTGKNFYYRVAAFNDLGISKSSDFEDREKSRGCGFADYKNRAINVRVTKNGFVAEWDKIPEITNYYLYKKKKGGAFAFVDNIVCNNQSEAKYSDSDPNIDINKDEIFYKVFPIYKSQDTLLMTHQNALAGDFELVNMNLLSFTVGENTVTLNTDKLKTELDSADIKIGYSGMSQEASDYTVEVPQVIELSASKNDPNVLGTIKVMGKVDKEKLSGLEKLNIKLVRVCFYGQETGVYPLSEPRRAIGKVSFTKRGIQHIAGVESFDIKNIIDPNTGVFQWTDPMHRFRDGQLIGGRHTWNYATWDTEAWKDIKRQKMFNQKRAVYIFYSLISERKSDPSWGPSSIGLIPETPLDNYDSINSNYVYGYPRLTMKEFAHLANWMKDVVLNRMSLIMVPRYAWNKTLSWLLGSNQVIPGENSPGSSARISTYQQGLGGAGQGKVDAGYSDWKGFTFQTDQDISMTVSLEVGKKREVGVSYSFSTPLYGGSVDLKMYCRDYNFHWGCYYDEPAQGREGHFKGTYNGVGEFSFYPGELMPYYDASWTGSYSPNGLSLRYGAQYGREAWDSGDEPYPLSNDDTEVCTTTRINLEYRPVPTNTDFTKKQYPHMIYNYIDK